MQQQRSGPIMAVLWKEIFAATPLLVSNGCALEVELCSYTAWSQLWLCSRNRIMQRHRSWHVIIVPRKEIMQPHRLSPVVAVLQKLKYSTTPLATVTCSPDAEWQIYRVPARLY